MNNFWAPKTTDESFFQRTVANCRYAGGISASGQTAGFAGNLFTRDTLRMLRDLMGQPQYWPFIREMLGILPQWQGVKTDERTNEAPNAMQHQVFREIVSNLRLPADRVESAKFWTGKWGVPMDDDPVNGWQFVIYNSSDGPLLYVITVADFCRATGSTAILKDTFLHRETGEWRTIGDAVSRCLNFITRSLDESERNGLHGLYAVRNTNPQQTSPSGVMRDGWDSYLRVRLSDDLRSQVAERADYDYMAYTENQALCYEALLRGGRELLLTDERAGNWIRRAEELRRRTFDLLFMDDLGCFAAAMDHDGLINLRSNSPFEMMNGPFFDGIEDTPDYIAEFAMMAYSLDFLTPIGIRMVSLSQAGIEAGGEYYAYQLSGAVWGVTNALIAKGFRRQGLFELSYDLGTLRNIGWFDRAGEAMEAGFVDRRSNEPLYDPFPPAEKPGDAQIIICPATLGQPEQGWSATGALEELWATRFGLPEESYGSWQRTLTRQLRSNMSDIAPAAAGRPSARVWPDVTRGKELQQQLSEKLNLVS